MSAPRRRAGCMRLLHSALSLMAKGYMAALPIYSVIPIYLCRQYSPGRGLARQPFYAVRVAPEALATFQERMLAAGVYTRPGQYLPREFVRMSSLQHLLQEHLLQSGQCQVGAMPGPGPHYPHSFNDRSGRRGVSRFTLISVRQYDSLVGEALTVWNNCIHTYFSFAPMYSS